MSAFLLDTNVISELIRPKPEARVTRWISAMDEALLYLSVLTIGEIRKGILMLRDPSRRVALSAWLDSDLAVRFSDRILPIDQAVADRWGQVTARQQASGSSIPVIDGLLAATALEHNLTFVTRNTRDVTQTGVPLFNPWTAT